MLYPQKIFGFLQQATQTFCALTATGIHTGIKPGLHGVTIDIKMLWRVIN